MNTLLKTLALSTIIISMSLLPSCDEIENPNNEGVLVVDTTAAGNPLAASTEPQLLKILLEDYTGHQCTNCPPAAELAKELEEEHPDQVEVLSVHAPDGFFQSTSSSYPRDYTTEAGTEYALTIPGFGGNPSGIINRSDASGFYWLFTASWADEVAQSLNNTAKISLAQDISMSANSDSIYVKVYAKAFEEVTGDVRVISMLVRKKVVSAQSMPNATTNENYEHYNVLSDNLNGVWGTILDGDQLIDVDALYSLDIAYAMKEEFLSDDTFETENLGVMTIICDRDAFTIYQTAFDSFEN